LSKALVGDLVEEREELRHVRRLGEERRPGASAAAQRA
jgi:hypothetical protein